jgi:SAM-dependent methyltransferase
MIRSVAGTQPRTVDGTALGCVDPDGPAPWHIGRPQPAIARLASAEIRRTVRDAGCGTGENALHVASLRLSAGLSVLGVDVADTARAIAREKAHDRGIDVEFAAADAFHWSVWGAGFRRCWTADCSIPPTATSVHDMWGVWRR